MGTYLSEGVSQPEWKCVPGNGQRSEVRGVLDLTLRNVVVLLFQVASLLKRLIGVAFNWRLIGAFNWRRSKIKLPNKFRRDCQ